jgi:beta-fructofuranosidase
MLIHPGNHLGDTWYYVRDDVAHCFYLTCPDTIERHTAWDIGHATSADLVHWDIHDLALRKGEPDEYDGICPATGSIIRHQNRYWLAYTGNHGGPIPTVAIAVSDDLYQWEKLPENPVTAIDPRYYATDSDPPRNWLHWRDPFLFEHDGWIYHYVCAQSTTETGTLRGTLGMARTLNMRAWEVLPPPDIVPVTMEFEVPLLLTWGNRYYLVFSTLPELLSETIRSEFPETQIRLTSYSMVGPTPFGPFTMHGNGLILPPDYAVQPYANQIVFWHGQPYLLGTVWSDEQDFICDPIPVRFTARGVKLA